MVIAAWRDITQPRVNSLNHVWLCIRYWNWWDWWFYLNLGRSNPIFPARATSKLRIAKAPRRRSSRISTRVIPTRSKCSPSKVKDNSDDVARDHPFYRTCVRALYFSGEVKYDFYLQFDEGVGEIRLRTSDKEMQCNVRVLILMRRVHTVEQGCVRSSVIRCIDATMHCRASTRVKSFISTHTFFLHEKWWHNGKGGIRVLFLDSL